MTDQLEAVLRKLAEQTERGRVRWTKVDSKAYRTFVEDVLIRISLDWNPDPDAAEAPAERYWVTVADGQGDVAEEEAVTPRTPAAFAVADQLFRHARRSSTNSAQVLDRVLRVLDAPAG